MRRVEQIMGTAIGLDLRDPIRPRAVEAFFEYLRDVDRRFSTYKPASEVSRLGRGEIGLDECSADVRRVLELCEEVRVVSRGYFDVRAHRSDGGVDPSGLVKGWALENAARILEGAGAANYCVNGGGDVVARGGPAPGQRWRVGVRHPIEADRLAAVLLCGDTAVATSGAYERGEHIVDPFTGRAPAGVLSVTVVGPDLTFADAYATAAFAMGRDGLAWLLELPGYEGCAITEGSAGEEPRLSWTPGFESLFAPPGITGTPDTLEMPGAPDGLGRR